MNSIRGMSLVETIVATAIFALVASAIFGTFTQVRKAMVRSEQHVLAVSLLNERMESVKNLPYADVGVVSGIPNGILLTTENVTRGGEVFTVVSNVRYVDLPFDGTAPTDLNPQDQKLVSVDVNCLECKNFSVVRGSAHVGPKSLEASAGLGSLFINVIDASGRPVSDALVHVTMASATPIDITERTLENGQLQFVGAPPAYQKYAIVVTKEGYTTDRNYDPVAATTTNPINPYATVASGQLTMATFVIDKVSPLDVYTVDSMCNRVSNVSLRLRGAKEIIAGGLRKFDKTYSTGASGYLSLPEMEWDNYDVTTTINGFALLGSNPTLPLKLLPGAAQALYLTMMSSSGGPNDNALSVIVRDAVTKNVISDATVVMEGPGGEIITQQTGRGTFKQTSWQGGAFHTLYDAPNVYDTDFGFTDVSTPGVVKLQKISGSYQSFGGINSSIIDTGSASNFFSITFNPSTQPLQTSLKFHLATAVASSGPWSFVGPDGTASTFFDGTIVNTPAVLDGKRYLRYKAYLDTSVTNKTPTLEDVSITFAGACSPPGVTGAEHLHDGSWNVTASATGYTNGTDSFTLNPSTPYVNSVIDLVAD